MCVLFSSTTYFYLPEVVLTQFVSPDDEHDVLETCRELKIKTNTRDIQKVSSDGLLRKK